MNVQFVILVIKRYPVAFVALVVLLAFFVVSFIRGGRVEILQQQQEELESELRVMRSNAKAASGLEEDLLVLKDEVSLLEERLFSVDEKSININFFYDFASRMDIQMNQIAFAGAFSPLFSKGKPKELKQFMPLIYDMQFTAPFERILEVMQSLEKEEPFVRIYSYKLLGGSGGAIGKELKVDLRLVILAEK